MDNVNQLKRFIIFSLIPPVVKNTEKKLQIPKSDRKSIRISEFSSLEVKWSRSVKWNDQFHASRRNHFPYDLNQAPVVTIKASADYKLF